LISLREKFGKVEDGPARIMFQGNGSKFGRSRRLQGVDDFEHGNFGGETHFRQCSPLDWEACAPSEDFPPPAR